MDCIRLGNREWSWERDVSQRNREKVWLQLTGRFCGRWVAVGGRHCAGERRGVKAGWLVESSMKRVLFLYAVGVLAFC